jgi:hypothetical protein
MQLQQGDVDDNVSASNVVLTVVTSYDSLTRVLIDISRYSSASTEQVPLRRLLNGTLYGSARMLSANENPMRHD